MKTLSSLLALVLALPVAAQEGGMPGPGPQHKKLAAQVGTWKAELEYMGETGEMEKSTGVSVRKQPLGGFWLIDNFQANMMGMQFRGQGTTGYDPAKKKYVGTWVDSMTPSLMIIEGNYDKTGKILTMEGMGQGFDGKPALTRLVWTDKDKNTQKFEMFTKLPDGKFMKTMTITYTRQVRKMDKVR